MRARLQDALPKLVLAPSFAVTLVFVYGFILWTIYLSFTNSQDVRRSYALTGARAYQRLWSWTSSRPAVELVHVDRPISAIFGVLYIVICLALGLLLAILLDQKIRGEGVLRPIYLYPMALSFIVTGTAWKWFLDPGLGLEQTLHDWGWTSFHFDWIMNQGWRSTRVVIAGVWQASGFVMAMFLAGLRGIDSEIMKAAQIDGATTFQTLPAHHHPDDAAGVPVGLHRARPPGDQVLRPRRGADQRRARAARPGCRRPSCTSTPSRATRWRSARPAP